MGKGLSPLQKTVLRVALKNRDAGDGAQGTRGCDALYREILAEHFGWPIPERSSKRTYGAKHFTKAAIGESRYRSNLASLSRAMLRLSERGLTECIRGLYWAGCNLTPEGEKTARALMVNKVETFHQVNQ